MGTICLVNGLVKPMARRKSEPQESGEIRIDIGLPGDTWSILFDEAVRRDMSGALYLRHVLIRHAEELTPPPPPLVGWKEEK